eukprot:3469326-Amphidinium_carterae.1
MNHRQSYDVFRFRLPRAHMDTITRGGGCLQVLIGTHSCVLASCNGACEEDKTLVAIVGLF